MTEIYHQLGFRYKWNLESIEADNTGDGIIIAPRYMAIEKVVSLPANIRQKAIFDPQFYLPDSDRGKLLTYPFFPKVVANGFSTSEWDEGLALESAYQCITFQLENEFRFITIPTRFREGMPTDYIESQSVQFINPFLKAYQNMGNPNRCLLQLILTDQMLNDEAYRRDILNWVTGIEEIDGIYLIYHFTRTNKQVEDIEFLFAVYIFVQALKQAGMFVVIGYLNTESIPLLCADPDIITMGSYENLRMFGTLPYEEKLDKKQQGPNPRVYVPILLQWIEHDYIGAISRVVGDADAFFEDNQYRVLMFEPTYQWFFTKPEPYKHYFLAFSNQFRQLAFNEGNKRLDAVKGECNRAFGMFKELENRGIVFDVNSGGGHLPKWLTFLNTI